jgi:hypothetical protein
MRRISSFAASIVLLSAGLFAQLPAWQPAPGHVTLPLWPGTAPGGQPNPAPEVDTTTAKDRMVAGKPVVRLGNVSSPTLTVYSPKTTNTGVGVVVFPGGGYKILAIDLEGTEVCDWLNAEGITCVLVKYRVPDSGPTRRQRLLCRMRSARLAWYGRMPWNGTSIRTGLECWDSPLERTSPRPSARISISASMIRWMRLTS